MLIVGMENGHDTEYTGDIQDLISMRDMERSHRGLENFRLRYVDASTPDTRKFRRQRNSGEMTSCFVPRIVLSAAYLIPGESGRDRLVHCDCGESEKTLGASRQGKSLKVLGL